MDVVWVEDGADDGKNGWVQMDLSDGGYDFMPYARQGLASVHRS